jgi:hypothetical protein
VAFRRGTDNQGRERIYRRVWAERFEDAARLRLWSLDEGNGYGFAALVDRYDRVVAQWGAEGVADTWSETRRGLNRGVNWRTGCTYARREAHRGGTAIEEADDWQRTLERVVRRG